MRKLFKALFLAVIMSRMGLPLGYGINLLIPIDVALSDTENDLWKNLHGVLYYISAHERSIFTNHNGDWFEYILTFYEDSLAEASFSVSIKAIIPNAPEITDFVVIPINVERYFSDTFYMSVFPRIIGFFLADGFRVYLETQDARIVFDANHFEVVHKEHTEEHTEEFIRVADDILEKTRDPRFHVPMINGW